MTGGAYVVSSSLGDLSRAPIGASTSIWHAGFWSGLAGAVAILPTCVLDIDDDGRIDALTDGVVLLRAMNGLTGSSVIANAIGPGAKRTTWPQIQSAINLPSLDIDGDGSTSAQTDGLLLIRSMFGLTGAAVTQGATGSGAQRDKWSDIRSFLNTNCGTSFAQ